MMNKHVALLLAAGFEEAEAIIILDVLARMDINVTTLACDPSKTLNSYHALSINADALLITKIATLYDAVVISGEAAGSTESSSESGCHRFYSPSRRSREMDLPHL
ncbi:DJ-1/PfpI family protein, partial [Yersinia intermedia]|uniref:DJ-1/PfpI family protein n=1 Tax=Yersinia intermedia TaxID=631 RepID=UPI0022441359